MAAMDTLGRRVVGRLPEPADPEPAIRLRELLAARRRRGEDWSDTEFERLAAVVVRGLERQPRQDWLLVFGAQQALWRAAYRRELAVRYTLDPT